MLDTDHLRRTANDMRGSAVHDLLRLAADEIDKLRAKSQPTLWTCEHQEGESFSCPDDAMDGASVKAFTEGFQRGREYGNREGRQELQHQLRRLINSPQEFSDN